MAFCRSTQQAFLRLLTQSVAEDYERQTNHQSWEAYDRFVEDEIVIKLDEPEGLEAIWRKLADRNDVSPKVWMDAYLAAFAISGGLRFVTFDQGFKSYVPYGLDLLLLNP